MRVALGFREGAAINLPARPMRAEAKGLSQDHIIKTRDRALAILRKNNFTHAELAGCFQISERLIRHRFAIIDRIALAASRVRSLVN